jgi:3'(2'), 5'-bisphosphate nucleotidase
MCCCAEAFLYSLRVAAAVVRVQDHGVEFKGDDSPLTKADTESNRIICEGLQRLSPHVPIISEETKTMPYDIRKVTQRS